MYELMFGDRMAMIRKLERRHKARATLKTGSPSMPTSSTKSSHNKDNTWNIPQITQEFGVSRTVLNRFKRGDVPLLLLNGIHS